MKKLLLLAITCIVVFSCNTKNELTLRESTGKMNSIVIVIDNSVWRAGPGDALRDIIASPVLGLPQEENQFSVTQVPVNTFNSIFETSRNILLIGYDSISNYSVKKNIYAKPQVVMTITGTDEAELLAQIDAHKEDIISVFKKEDLKLYQKKLAKDLLKNDSLRTFKNLGFSIDIPRKYRLVDDTGDFLWFRNHIDKGSTNLIAYQLPLDDTDSIANTIASTRDTIGKKYIPGPSDGSYMITEAAYSPHIKKTELNGKETFESRGKWEVKGDYMAGPFINYTIVDKPNNRLLVLEGFTYAPNVNKRDYMFELEAIIKTLKI